MWTNVIWQLQSLATHSTKLRRSEFQRCCNALLCLLVLMQHSILTLSLFKGFCERIEILPFLKEYAMRMNARKKARKFGCSPLWKNEAIDNKVEKKWVRNDSAGPPVNEDLTKIPYPTEYSNTRNHQNTGLVGWSANSPWKR